ncbi:MAG: 50S ribosomal protein L13 [Chloroflexota bacterium]|nr:50S ribosomal protein L13 [Chloroflexota bacterium]
MAIRQRMHQPKASELKPEWHVVDAKGQTLGRICSDIARLLQGKHRSSYVPYMNTGDFVVVINAEKIEVTGNKREQKKYYSHSGYHGGLKEISLQQLLDSHPDRVIRQSVKGMLPKNIPGRKMLSRLKVYAGETHPHEAQVNWTEKSKELQQDKSN